MSSARDLFIGSLEILGVVAAGETPPAEDLATCLSHANRMLRSWSVSRLMIPNRVREEFALVAGQASRTMGPSGNFDTARPVIIHDASVMESGSTNEIPLKIHTPAQWAAIANKGVQSSIPQVVYPEGKYPLETLNFWPVPNATPTLVLYSDKPLQTFASINDTVILPPEYEDAIQYNLAMRMQSAFRRSLSEDDRKIARDSLSSIKRNNTKPVYMKSDISDIKGGAWSSSDFLTLGE